MQGEAGMKVFVVAMACEAETVVRHLADVRRETLFGREVVQGTLDGTGTAVVVAGVGKVNAAAGAQLALGALRARALLNVGVAGGLDTHLRVGDILRATRAVQYDFDLSRINGTPVGTPNECQTPYFELAAAPGDWPAATVATGDRFLDDEGENDLLRRTFGANVREMELGAIAHVASRADVPLYAWKAISDVAGQGTMSGQYKINLDRCLEILAREVPALFAAVP